MIRPGWTPGPSHGVDVDLRRRLPRRPIGAVVPVAGGDGRRQQDRLLQPRDGGTQEGAGIGPDRALRRAASRRRRPSRGSRSTWIQRWPGGRDRVAAGRHLAEPRADARAARRRSGCARARTRGSRSPPCPGTAAWSLGITSPRRQAATTGHVEELREPDEVVRAARPQDAGAGEDHGPLGRGEEVQHGAHVARRPGASGCARTTGTRVALGDRAGGGRPRAGRSARDRAGPRRWPGPRPRASPRRSPGRRSRPPTWRAARRC